ncbi:MAG: Ig-like domain-containing protein, partial [Gemmatimonadaceae bacterium]
GIGATQQFTAQVSPPGAATAVTWGSSNAAVATVSQSGLVTGVSAGSATISAAAGGKVGTSDVTVTAAPPPPPPGAVFVGAGDIASCSSTGDEATANLLDGIAGTVFTLGDNVYDSGTSTEFTNCYDPTWGRFKTRTNPAPGNHDYVTPGASGYYGYFGSAAGDPAKGYYSYDLGDWHIIALNSNIARNAGSAQEQWLRVDLAASTKSCTLAYWHHARFSSGLEHGNDVSLQPLWQALYDANADVILSGHDHDYERFAPQTPAGAADPATGIREFVVGTGGRSHYILGTLQPNSQVFNGTTYGVLKMTLSAGSYSWEFIPVAGATFTDSGTANCH